MALVHHDEIILIYRRGLRIVCCVENALYQSLNGANVNLGLAVRCYVLKLLEPENIRERPAGNDLRGRKLTGSLMAKRRPVNHKANWMESFFIRRNCAIG